MSNVPPAPPPPPPVFKAPKVLARSERQPENRVNVGSVRPTQPPDRSSPFAGVHPETLQHAAASLRKTQYREPLLSRNAEPGLGRQDQFPPGGYWPGGAQHEALERNPAGTQVPIATNGVGEPSAFSELHGYTDSLNGTNGQRAFSSYEYSSTTSNNSSAPTTFVPISVVQVPQQGNPVSSYSYSYTSQQLPSQQPQPKTTTYSYSYSSQQPPAQKQNSSSSSSYSYEEYVRRNRAQNETPIDVPAPPPLPQTQPPPLFSNNNSTSNNANVILNPKDYIHEFAVNTPAAVLEPSGPYSNGSNSTSTTLHKIARPANYAEELRDSSLTERQRYSNQFQKPLLAERPAPSSIQSVYQETRTSNFQRDAVNDLIKDMEWKMRTGQGAAGEEFCSKCSTPIGSAPGVTALGHAYHVTCFTCDVCQKQLAGCSFYNVDGKNLCQVDYMNTLEKCEKCATPITSKILRAIGKAFHPECFACPGCMKSLDGIPFTLDKENKPYCLDCFHERFSPRCAKCLKVIAPGGNETEVARVIAMDKSYHVDCYCCEDCGLKLNSKIEGQGCYPLESHLFCKNCNLKRLKSVR